MAGWLWFLIQFVLIAAFITYIVISSKKALAENRITWFMKTWKKDSVKSIASSLTSIVFGLLIGCIILIIMTIIPSKGVSLSFKTAMEGIQLVFSGIFNIGRTDGGALKFGFDPVKFGDMLFSEEGLVFKLQWN